MITKLSDQDLICAIIADAINRYGKKLKPNTIRNKIHAFKSDRANILKTFDKKSVFQHIANIPKARMQEYAKKYNLLRVKKNRRTHPEIKNMPQNPIMRVAPNPNYSPTLGNLKTVILNSYFAKKYNGKLDLRFDDTIDNLGGTTRAKNSYKNAMKMFYGSDFRVYSASSRSLIYDTAIIALFNKKLIYVCKCKKSTYAKFKLANKNCPCFGKYENFRDLKYFYNAATTGVAILRLKCMKPQEIMNWPLMRILKSGRRSPLLNFQSAIDDRVEKTNLILRGKDLMASEIAQKKLYDRLGWQYPRCVYWGRNKILGATMSSSKLLESGISDTHPSTPTYENLINLGFPKMAIEQYYILDVGLTLNDTTLNISQLISRAEKYKKIIKIEPAVLKNDWQTREIFEFLKAKKIILKIPKSGLIHIPEKGGWFRFLGGTYTHSKTGQIVKIN